MVVRILTFPCLRARLIFRAKLPILVSYRQLFTPSVVALLAQIDKPSRPFFTWCLLKR
jgi:hypothetical protein